MQEPAGELLIPCTPCRTCVFAKIMHAAAPKRFGRAVLQTSDHGIYSAHEHAGVFHIGPAFLPKTVLSAPFVINRAAEIVAWSHSSFPALSGLMLESILYLHCNSTIPGYGPILGIPTCS